MTDKCKDKKHPVDTVPPVVQPFGGGTPLPPKPPSPPRPDDEPK